MVTFRPLGAVLCAYELGRLGFLIGAALRLQPGAMEAFPLLALVTPGALFFLMSLFWLVDLPRYRVFGPLFMTGKGLSAITTAFWIF
ncbi:MAG: hypothetical protein FWE09_04530, partial [Treponema sp.]|nr:hypothetical protein [Treponema sp.]